MGDFKKRNSNPKGLVTLGRPTREVVLSFKGRFKLQVRETPVENELGKVISAVVYRD